MDLGIQENKQALRGDYGYIAKTKKRNLKIVAILITACILVFIAGIALNNQITVYLNLISALLILPTAQFLAKYFSVFKMSPIKKEKFEAVEGISNDFLTLGEIAVIRGRNTYFTLITVITRVGVYVLVEGSRDPVKEKQKISDTKEAVTSIIKAKGHHDEVRVYADYDEFYNVLKTEVKSKSGNPDEKKLGKIAEALLMRVQ